MKAVLFRAAVLNTWLTSTGAERLTSPTSDQEHYWYNKSTKALVHMEVHSRGSGALLHSVRGP